ncbi:MAG TPA: enolase C-terminal domain-like protein, partial [Chloroflexota bacterium]|nr:enolase C-terminal domain-like protein [Chloroflexota bacterium]
MKVTAIKPYILENPGPRKFVFIKLETDEGLHGWGEGTCEMKQNTVVAAVRDLEQFVIGEDPTRVDYIWQRMYRHGFWRGGVAILSAISGIEHALWDITGKAYGQPVYKLLGGAVRDFIPCYTHCGRPEQALALMEEGWRAFKSGPRGWRQQGIVPTERVVVCETAEAFAAMRDACGEEVELMCDAHGRPRPSLAIRIGHALEPYNLLFLEEAVPPDNVQNLELVREAGLKTDLATGERAFTKWGFREMIEGQLVDIIQPDICHDGGIKETLKIGAMAETYEIKVAP